MNLSALLSPSLFLTIIPFYPAIFTLIPPFAHLFLLTLIFSALFYNVSFFSFCFSPFRSLPLTLTPPPSLFSSQSLQRLLNKKNEDGDLDLEEETRQLMILQLQSYARDSIGEIDMIKQVRMRLREGVYVCECVCACVCVRERQCVRERDVK